MVVSGYWQHAYIMTDLMQIISNGTANIKLEITSEDLRNFSNELINRAVNEVAAALKATNEDRLLTREEVKSMCGVCDTTLWLWNKRNYLKTVKVGNKVRYRYSDVKRILGETNRISGNGKFDNQLIPHENEITEKVEEEYVRVGTTLFRILNQPMMNGSFRKMRVEWKMSVFGKTTARMMWQVFLNMTVSARCQAIRTTGTT